MHRSAYAQVSSGRAVLRRGSRLAATILWLLGGISCVVFASAKLVSGQPQNSRPQVLSDEDLDATVVETSKLPLDTITDTAWTIELNPREGTSSHGALEDMLTFADGLMRSTRSTADGYRPAAYLLGTGLDGQLVWESAQHHADGAAIFWHGELEGDRMRGAFSKRLDNGSLQSFVFVGTQIALPNGSPRPREVEVASGAPSSTAPSATPPTPARTELSVAAQLDSAARQVSEAKSEMTHFESAYQKTQSELAQAREQVRVVSMALEGRTAERDEAQATLAKADQERKHLEKMLSDSEQSRQQLNAELEQLRTQLNERNAQREQLSQELRTRIRERDAAISEKTKATTQATDRERELVQSQTQLKTLEADLQARTQERDAAQAALQTQQGKLEQAATHEQRTKEELEKQLTQAREQLQNLEQTASMNTKLSQDLAALRTTLLAEQDAKRQAETTLKTHLQQVAKEQSAAQNAQQHEQQAQAAQAQAFAKLRDEHAQLQARFKTNQGRAQQLETDLSRFQSQVKSLQASLKARSDERDAAQAAATEAHQAYEALTHEHASAKTARSQLETALAKAKEQITTLNTDLGAHVKELEAAHATQAELQRNLASVQASLHDKDQALEAHQRQSIALQNERDQSLAELHAAMTSHQQARDALNKQVVQLQQQLESLTKERDTARNAQRERQKAQARLEQTLATTKAALQTKEQALTEGERALADSRAEANRQLSDLRTALQTQQDIQRQQEAELQQVHAQVHELEGALQSRITQDTTALDQVQQDRSQLKIERDRIQTQLQDQQQLREHVLRLQSTIQERTQMLAEEERALSDLRQQLEQQDTARAATLTNAQRPSQALEAELLRTREEQREEQVRLHEELVQLETVVRQQANTLEERNAMLKTLHLQLAAQQTKSAEVQPGMPQALQALAEAQDHVRAQEDDQQRLHAEVTRLEAAFTERQRIRQQLDTKVAQLRQQLGERIIQRQETAKASENSGKEREVKLMDSYAYRRERAMAMALELHRLLATKHATSQPK